MSIINIESIIQYIEDNIDNFHNQRLERLDNLDLKTILKKKNPYLFKAKNVTTSDEIVRGITDAFLSSNEETMFGKWLEGLAIFINSQVYNGRKSSTQGVDLEFEKDSIRYIVAIKSGPNWGNSSQIKKMKSDFMRAIRVIRQGGAVNIIAVNGCCYGKDNRPDKGDYLKLCGQRFWEFVSGSTSLYTDIIEPLGHQARARNNEFQEKYGRKINLFVRDFSIDFCDSDGAINWNKLVKYNSGK